MSITKRQIEDLTKEMGEYAARMMLAAAKKTDYLRATCVNCDHFNKAREVCEIATGGPKRPPAKVIAYGCEMFVDEDVPF